MRRKRLRRRSGILRLAYGALLLLAVVGLGLWAITHWMAPATVREESPTAQRKAEDTPQVTAGAEQKADPAPERPLRPEDVRVRVLNSSGINGAGAEVGEVLKGKGFTVVSIGNGETSDREQTIIMAPLRSVDLFYGMPFPCIIMVSEDKEQATVYIGRDFAP